MWLPVASCQFIRVMELFTWLPFAGCLFSFSHLKPSKIELASGCQLHRIGIRLPLDCCQFIRVSELIPGCHLPVAYLTLVVLNHLKSNWHLAASCQFIRVSELIPGCHLPVAYLALVVLNHLKSNWHLAVSCQLPIHKSKGCLFSFIRLKPSKIELASGCQLPVANS